MLSPIVHIKFIYLAEGAAHLGPAVLRPNQCVPWRVTVHAHAPLCFWDNYRQTRSSRGPPGERRSAGRLYVFRQLGYPMNKQSPRTGAPR